MMEPPLVTIPNGQPYREPLRATLLRTGLIAVAIGAVLTLPRGGLARWPAATLVALWPALGGHFIELLFLNVLRPRLARSRAVQIAARLLTWFLGGVGLTLAIFLTARLVGWQPACGQPLVFS